MGWISDSEGDGGANEAGVQGPVNHIMNLGLYVQAMGSH